MPLLESNSNRSAAKKEESYFSDKDVVTEDVEIVKPMKDTIIDIFFGDFIRNLRGRNPFYVIMKDYVAPKIIDGIFEFAEEKFASSRRTNRSRNSSGYSPYNNVPYNTMSMYGGSVKQPPAEEDISMDYRDLCCRTRGDAELVLDKLRAATYEKGKVRVGDVFRLFNRTPNDYQMWSYGWHKGDLDRVYPIAVRGGKWNLNLPEAKLLNG